MDNASRMRLMGLVDSKGLRGVLSRGKPMYPGATSPNPMGKNSAKVAKLLLKKRKALSGSDPFTR